MISEALLNSDGTHAVAWESATLTDGRRGVGGIGAGDESIGRVEIRETSARATRRYELRGLLNGAELSLFRTAESESAGWAEAIRWRHPGDALVVASECPLWRVIDASVPLRRGSGGIRTEVSLTIEEV